MKTTINLPNDLIEEAMKITGIKRKSQLIIYALEEIVNKSKRHNLLKYKGKIDLNIDLDALRGRV